MKNHMFKIRKHCRWCQTVYYAHKPVDRDGFCSKAHKQALYRARKRSVTANESISPLRR